MVLVIVAILVVAGAATAVYVLLSQPAPPNPPGVALASVQLSTSSGTTTSDQTAWPAVTALAKDSAGKDQTANTTFRWSVSPAGAAQIYGTGVPKTVRVRTLQAGLVTVTANGTWSGSAKEGSLSLTVNPISFQLTSSTGNPLIGSYFALTLRVLRSDHSAYAAYNGTVNFTSDDSEATLPANFAFNAANAGTATFSNVVVRKAGAVVITVRDTEAAVSNTTTVNGNRAPTASFSMTPSGANPSRITVDATASSDPDLGDTLSYAWQFGDATTGTGLSLTHTYAAAGTYAVNLTVADNHGATNRSSKSFTAHTLPVALFGVENESANGPSEILLWVNATASMGGDGTITYYNWTWGDGNQSQVTGPLAAHNYSMSWNDTVVPITLRIGNSFGFVGSISKNVLVTTAPPPPIAAFTDTWTVGPVVNRLAYRTLSVDATDSYSPGGLAIVHYNWTWGDGSPNTNVTTPQASHVYATDGTYVVNLTVVDSFNQNGSVEISIVIAVAPSPPVPIFNFTRAKFVVHVDANASWDPNNDAAYYDWAWGDGSAHANGTNPWAVHDYTSNGAGRYTVTLTVIDATNRKASVSKAVTVASTTLDYSYYDFFNVPYGEWWDMRFPQYKDLPVGANCFNASSVADGICTRNSVGVPAAESYPYMDWYPLPTGSLFPGTAGNNPLIYAPYRFSVVGVNVPNYDITTPVLLPICTDLKANYSAYPVCPATLPSGSSVNLQWDMQYLDLNSELWLDGACGTSTYTSNDGYIIVSNLTLSMDLSTASRLFGSPTTSPGDATTWWNSYGDPYCGVRRAVSNAFQNWLVYLGGSSTKVGPYDIFNGYQYYYSPFQTYTVGTVDPTTGQTTVKILHVAWGTEALLARLFYWGSAYYTTNLLDSTKAKGWWGMELAWFEDFHFNATIGAAMDFTLKSVMQYHFQESALPGPDGVYRGQTGEANDDIPTWSWGPILSDYVSTTPSDSHPYSELNRYPSPYYRYVHTTPGSPVYAQNLSYDFAPIAWNLKAGETWHFRFPTGNVVFHDPNLSPLGAIPYNSSQNNGYVVTQRPLAYDSTLPAGYGTWDATNLTWDVIGPTTTGGAAGTAGPDGVPGTTDDQYPLDSRGAITFVDPPATVYTGAWTVSTRTAPSSGSAALIAMVSSLSPAIPTADLPMAAPTEGLVPSHRFRD